MSVLAGKWTFIDLILFMVKEYRKPLFPRTPIESPCRVEKKYAVSNFFLDFLKKIVL